jgi:hypothetical protein
MWGLGRSTWKDVKKVVLNTLLLVAVLLQFGSHSKPLVEGYFYFFPKFIHVNLHGPHIKNTKKAIFAIFNNVNEWEAYIHWSKITTVVPNRAVSFTVFQFKAKFFKND